MSDGGHKFEDGGPCTRCGMSEEHFEDNGRPACRGVNLNKVADRSPPKRPRFVEPRGAGGADDGEERGE